MSIHECPLFDLLCQRDAIDRAGQARYTDVSCSPASDRETRASTPRPGPRWPLNHDGAMTAIPPWANASRWGDVPGPLVRFGVDRAANVALGRLALTFDPDRRHDLVWVFKLRGQVTRMGNAPAASGDERVVQGALQ